MLLTPEQARALGIEVYENTGAEIIAPDQRPIVDLYAKRAVAFAFLGSRCTALFQPDSLAIHNGAKTAIKKGKEMVSHEQWLKLGFQWLDEMKQDIKSKGDLPHCIDVEADLRRQGLSTGIDGPSFNCAAASSQVDRTICTNSLWAKDRALSAIYFYARGTDDLVVRKRLLELQRKWLAFRNACGADNACLNKVYDERLHDLREIGLPGE